MPYVQDYSIFYDLHFQYEISADFAFAHIPPNYTVSDVPIKSENGTALPGMPLNSQDWTADMVTKAHQAFIVPA